MARISVSLIIGAFLLASMLLILPNLNVAKAESTAFIETQIFSDSWFMIPLNVTAAYWPQPLAEGTQLRIIFNASEPIDFFCQNSFELEQSRYNNWTKPNVSSHWSNETAFMNTTYMLPSTDIWYFTLANYDKYNAVAVYAICIYKIDTYEIHVENNRANYSIAEHATMTANVSRNGKPATGLAVNIQVSNPNGTIIINQNKQTNAQGQATLNFTSPSADGNYSVMAKATIFGVTIEDSAFFTVAKDVTPPITVSNYNDSWSTADFNITLSATDNETGVSETYYRINNSPALNVSTDGQPRIITESANNTLEYWSIDNAGNEETPHKILTGIKLDKTPPEGYVLINGNATYTNSTSVTLTLNANDTTSAVYQVRLSNDGSWDTEPWESLQSNKTWTLTSSDGIKTVYYQIKDNAGLVSATYSDAIILDTKGPVGSVTVNEGAAYATGTSVTLTLSAMDTMSGIAEMRFSNDNTTYIDWQAYATSKTWNLSEGDGSKTVYVQFKDRLGLISTCSDTIILDTVQPTGFVMISGGETCTNSISVMLTVSAQDNISGVAQMRFSNDNTSWSSWEAYAISKQWTLLPGDGTKIVNVQYRDNVGLTSSCSDSIILDTTNPTANAGANQTVYAGRLVTFDASASTDENGIGNYTWTFIDVTAKTLTGETPNYNFTKSGVYTVTLEVADFAGNSEIGAMTVTVLTIPTPVANAGQNQTVNVGAIVTFAATASSDETEIVSFKWDFGDGTNGTGETATHTYTKPGEYTVTLTVRNEFGSTNTNQIAITVISEGTPTWVIGTAIAAIALFTGVLATMLWKKRTTSIRTIFSPRKT